MRPSGRQENQIRKLSIETSVLKATHGSCIIKLGDTHVLCTATIDENVPRHIKGTRSGWLTAEYGMLPGSTSSRNRREASLGKQSGRTIEIQRLIGRSLRSSLNLKDIGEKQIIIDCDVLQADGGTRTASITGGYVALHLALKYGVMHGFIKKFPDIKPVAAISCGIYNNNVIADLDYYEDSHAQVDANFVFNDELKIIEIQGTAEEKPFNKKELDSMIELAQQASINLFNEQKRVLGLDG